MQITPYLTTLSFNVALLSFWRKPTLRLFLKQCGISEKFLSTWHSDETKRDFLTRLFEQLPKNDAGRKAIERIANYLSEQKEFPDLENWEDSKIKIGKAKKAVSDLKSYLQSQKSEIADEAEKAASRRRLQQLQEQAIKSRQSLTRFSKELAELSMQLGSQKAGYTFQEWFFNLLDFYEIQNRRPYTSNGRQIDGSLTLNGTTYLIELKFTKEQSDSTDIDSLYRKVTSKADNTMGIMISISGYSSVAIQEASGERTPLLLLDHNHIYLCLGGLSKFGDIIDRIRRHASQTGEAYLHTNDFG